jgi:hypothetical protein
MILKKRAMKNNGFCRGCDISLEKGDEVIYTYSLRNRGQRIFFYMECANKISELANNH